MDMQDKACLCLTCPDSVLTPINRREGCAAPGRKVYSRAGGVNHLLRGTNLGSVGSSKYWGDMICTP
jgi:hypothetical protein